MALLALVTCAHGSFYSGPEVLDDLPRVIGAPVLEAPARALLREPLSPRVVQTVQTMLKTGQDILIVGHTDAFGPKQLNLSLGRQYAVNAADRLAGELKLDLSRFHCYSRGEDPQAVEPGIAIYAMAPPQRTQSSGGKALTLLTPTEGRELGPNIWALWEADATNAYWGIEDAHGPFLWKVPRLSPSFTAPFPAYATKTAVGVQYQEGPALVEWTGRERKPEPSLTMSVDSLEQGHAHLVGRVPAGVRKLTVWAGGIPYPAMVYGDRFYAAVVRYGQGTEACAQGVDARGRVVFGPALTLPPNAEGDPRMIAVIVWEGKDAEVELHGWRASGHTSAADPDPAISRVSAPGVRLLFSGTPAERASALWIEEPSMLEIEARLAGREPARATVYVLTDPGDPVLRKGMILGPRNLSPEPSESRWPVLNLRDLK